jgi:hypothetical protein
MLTLAENAAGVINSHPLFIPGIAGGNNPFYYLWQRAPQNRNHRMGAIILSKEHTRDYCLSPESRR